MENQSDHQARNSIPNRTATLARRCRGFFVPDYANALDPFDEDYEKQKILANCEERIGL